MLSPPPSGTPASSSSLGAPHRLPGAWFSSCLGALQHTHTHPDSHAELLGSCYRGEGAGGCRLCRRLRRAGRERRVCRPRAGTCLARTEARPSSEPAPASSPAPGSTEAAAVSSPRGLAQPPAREQLSSGAASLLAESPVPLRPAPPPPGSRGLAGGASNPPCGARGAAPGSGVPRPPGHRRGTRPHRGAVAVSSALPLPGWGWGAWGCSRECPLSGRCPHVPSGPRAKLPGQGERFPPL